MKFLQEFKEFAIKGNMFDMAIGIIIGAAFSKIVSSLVLQVLPFLLKMQLVMPQVKEPQKNFLKIVYINMLLPMLLETVMYFVSLLNISKLLSKRNTYKTFRSKIQTMQKYSMPLNDWKQLPIILLKIMLEKHTIKLLQECSVQVVWIL